MLYPNVKPSMEVSSRYPQGCLISYIPDPAGKTTTCREQQDREKSKVEAVERFFQMTEFTETTNKRKVT